MIKLTTHAIAAYGATPGPNISTAIMLAAIGVLAAPANTLTKPIAEKVAESTPKTCAKREPAVAPIKNMGVTIPPLPPKPSVTLVKTIFKINAYQTTFCPCRVAWMVFNPSLRYCVVNVKVIPMSATPPIIPLNGVHMCIRSDTFLIRLKSSIKISEQMPKKIPARITFTKKNVLKTGANCKGL